MYITVGSSDTASHPIALGEILLDPSIIENPDTPEAMRLAKAILNHYGDVAEEYLSMLRTRRKNPKTFLNAVKRTREEGRIPTEAEKYIDLLEKTNGQGVAHKQLTNLFVSYLKNRYFSDGIFKGKRIGKGNATHAYLKPARHLENLIEDGNVAISYDNSTVRSKVIDHWASFNRASIERQIPNSSKWSNSRLFYHFAKEKTFTVVFNHNEDYIEEIEKQNKSHGAFFCEFVHSNRIFDEEDKFHYVDENGEKQFLEKSYKKLPVTTWSCNCDICRPKKDFNDRV